MVSALFFTLKSCYAREKLNVRVVTDIFTGRNEVVAKVIFLQASVCPRGVVCVVRGGSGLGGCLAWRGLVRGVWSGLGGLGLLSGGGVAYPPRPKIFFGFFFWGDFFGIFFFGFLWGPLNAPPPPPSRLRHMVNEWLVHILLKCILVTGKVCLHVTF